MATIKTDPRIRRTRSAIRAAFFRLMKAKEFDSITVTDISDCADINRKTFYAHYESKEQLFAELIQEMFSDIFSTFMYEKKKPGSELDEDVLIRDIVRYIEKIEYYREALDTLFTAQTSWMAFELADQVIRDKLSQICVTCEAGKEIVPTTLFIARIKNFFMTTADWWMDQEHTTPQEAAVVLAKMMRKSTVNIFRYQQMQRSSMHADTAE